MKRFAWRDGRPDGPKTSAPLRLVARCCAPRHRRRVAVVLLGGSGISLIGCGDDGSPVQHEVARYELLRVGAARLLVHADFQGRFVVDGADLVRRDGRPRLIVHGRSKFRPGPNGGDPRTACVVITLRGSAVRAGKDLETRTASGHSDARPVPEDGCQSIDVSR